MRILLISANLVGDAILASGLLDRLIPQHPRCRVAVARGGLVSKGVSARIMEPA